MSQECETKQHRCSWVPDTNLSVAKARMHQTIFCHRAVSHKDIYGRVRWLSIACPIQHTHTRGLSLDGLAKEKKKKAGWFHLDFVLPKKYATRLEECHTVRRLFRSHTYWCATDSLFVCLYHWLYWVTDYSREVLSRICLSLFGFFVQLLSMTRVPCHTKRQQLNGVNRKYHARIYLV